MDAKKLKEIMADSGLNKSHLADELGVSIHTVNSWIKGQRNIPEPKRKLIEMVTKRHIVSETSLEYDVKSGAPIINNGGVPYYDVDFHGGFDFVFNDQTIQPSFNIDYAPYNDCDAWINVTGKSMSPFISHGDIAALKKLNDWRSFIPFGEIYAVLTNEHKTIKIVSQGKDENHLKLIPYNDSKEFVAQEIPKDLIQQMYRVKGSIKKFF